MIKRGQWSLTADPAAGRGQCAQDEGQAGRGGGGGGVVQGDWCHTRGG